MRLHQESIPRRAVRRDVVRAASMSNMYPKQDTLPRTECTQKIGLMQHRALCDHVMHGQFPGSALSLLVGQDSVDYQTPRLPGLEPAMLNH